MGQGLGGPALAHEGLGEALVVGGDQFLAADLFGQGKGLTRHGLGGRPVLPVEGQISQATGIFGHALGVTDDAGHAQGLAVMLLGSREVAGAPLGIGEVVQADGHVHALGGEASVQVKHLTVGGDGGGVIRLQLMADATQADGECPLAGTGLGAGPVRGSAVGAGEHGGGLLAQFVNVASK